MILHGACRWAIAAIYIMKKSWAANDAGIPQVRGRAVTGLPVLVLG
jgi:hypothetical protein